MEARTIIAQYVKEMRKKYKLTQVDLSEKAEVGLRFVNEYQLTPAYDLLSMALVIPEDTEELALTLCGKKRKLPRQHFVEAMIASGLDEKVCNNILARFGRLLPEWEACIRQSFHRFGYRNTKTSEITQRITLKQ